MKVNVVKFLRALLFIVCVLTGLYMGYIFVVNGLSWFGLYIGVMSWGTAISILGAFQEEQRASSTRTTQRQRKYA